MASGQMPRIDMDKEFNKFSPRDQHFIKKVTEMNKTRAMNRFLVQHRNKWTAALIISGVMGIYVYTMSAVQQENFLDDFDPPSK
ncbi:hypothetical protein LSH36_353g00030 [Paralvinella palmiformis]|uniref:Cytochrome c oxidase assembly factor 3 n=1 Tax=Paralvinella palmiformis TaxID=53620 RepID=A0AAD9JEK8_9ANNE|nr:hypothetical protein LSH36_353g00030 [Paralvinella palmiformis]